MDWHPLSTRKNLTSCPGSVDHYNTFRPEFFDGGFCNFQGSFLPFAATKKERIMAGDPRLSLEERYPTKEAYVSAVSKAADSLVEARMLLPEDRERLVKEAQEKGVRAGP
nr:alpha/beta hydrolase domain-containing protein [Pseudomonas tremae]